MSGYLISSPQANSIPLTTEVERARWYQFYFATKRGRVAYEANRDDLAKLIWRQRTSVPVSFAQTVARSGIPPLPAREQITVGILTLVGQQHVRDDEPDSAPS